MGFLFVVAVWTGFEPATPAVTGQYSNQLNYHTVADFWECKDNRIINKTKNYIKIFSVSVSSVLPIICEAFFNPFISSLN